MGIWGWSKTAGSNTSLESISWAEGMNAANVNNGVRAIAAALKKWQEDIGGALVSTGAANSYALSTNGTLAALADGVLLVFIANHSNSGAATLNVDTLGAKAIRKGGDAALVSGDIPSGMACLVSYDASANSAAGAWLLHNPYVDISSKQASDAGLTDIAALAVTDGNIIVGDGTNWVAESGATARASLGLTIGTHVQAYDAQLADIAGLAVADGNVIVGDGTNWVAESGATARTSLGAQAADASLTSLAGLTLAEADVLYAAAPDTLANLAKGTANQVLAMNAGATAPEWQTPSSSGLSAASQAEQETGSSTSVAVTPGRQHFHPGHPKFWCLVTGGGTPTIAASYNVTSVTDTATGRLTVNIATDFSGTGWCCIASVEAQMSATGTAAVIYSCAIDPGSRAAGSVILECVTIEIDTTDTASDQTGAYADPSAWHVCGYGDQ